MFLVFSARAARAYFGTSDLHFLALGTPAQSKCIFIYSSWQAVLQVFFSFLLPSAFNMFLEAVLVLRILTFFLKVPEMADRVPCTDRGFWTAKGKIRRGGHRGSAITTSNHCSMSLKTPVFRHSNLNIESLASCVVLSDKLISGFLVARTGGKTGRAEALFFLFVLELFSLHYYDIF